MSEPGIHADLLERHRKVLPSWLALYYKQPIALVDGEGRRVRDAEGREYLDFFGGILTTISGYNVPEVVKAVREQAGRMVHTSTLYLIEQQIELAERIAALSPIPDAKVFFTNSGTEANDTALLLATTYRRSNQVLALRNSYHGRSYSSMAITGNRSWSSSSFSPLQVTYVHGGYRYRSPFGHLPDAEYVAACVADLRDMLQVATSGDVACLIAEPIQGVGGFATPPDGLLGAMKEVLDESGILLVADEVQTGWGRTGENFWGIEAHGVVPDIMTFAKGAGNGLAIGGVVARADVMDSIGANSISTFGGNPLVMAGALANLDYMLEHDLQTNAHKVGNHLRARIDPLVDEIPIVGEVRGKGLMIGVELVHPGGREPNPEAAAAVMEGTKQRGLLIGKGGLHGNVLRIAPPLSLTEDEADEGFEILHEALEEAANPGRLITAGVRGVDWYPEPPPSPPGQVPWGELPIGSRDHTHSVLLEAEESDMDRGHIQHQRRNSRRTALRRGRSRASHWLRGRVPSPMSRRSYWRAVKGRRWSCSTGRAASERSWVEWLRSSSTATGWWYPTYPDWDAPRSATALLTQPELSVGCASSSPRPATNHRSCSAPRLAGASRRVSPSSTQTSSSSSS